MDDEQTNGGDPSVEPPPATPDRPASRLHAINVVLGAIAVGVVAIAVALPNLKTGHTGSHNRIVCASNLRQICTAMMMYADANGGAFPDSFATLLRNEDIDSYVFVCPNSNDTPSVAPTTEAQAVDLAKPGHLSYVYLGRGLNNTAPSTAVLAYEPLIEHGGAGVNVLFGDGHVDWVASPKAQRLINELIAGFNPPRAQRW